MQDNTQLPSDDRQAGRWTLIRDVGVLQIKLIVDGIRDLVLVPVSLLAGLISLVKYGQGSGAEFYDLLRLGKKSERWINLFGAVDNAPKKDAQDDSFANADIDGLVSRVESFVVDEYRKGGVTKQAKEGLDRAIDSLHRFATRDINGTDSNSSSDR